MEYSNMLSHLVSLGAELEHEDAGIAFDGFKQFASGRLRGIRFYYFEGAGGLSKRDVAGFFRTHTEGCLITALDHSGMADVYAQTFLDREPVVVQALDWKNNADFWSLFELPGYLEFVFELDRRFGRRRLEMRFVSEFRKHRNRLADAWIGLTDGCESVRMQIALDTMLRMFFVAFLAARGTLDQRRSFLSDEACRCVKEGRSIYRDFIQPLFFETLNRPVRHRTVRAIALGDIPFLNGGLFTPSELEKQSPQLNAPNAVWLDVIDFFGRYALSTDRSETKPILRLDPMMLGHVFESLMSQDARRSTGSYYTPMPLARTLAKESFEYWLIQNGHLTEDEARQGIALGDFGFLSVERARKLDLAIADMTVLDPAVGSGAFLQCAFELIHKIRSGLMSRCGETVHSGLLARQIVSRNLYGVDIIPAANQLCELRLWLELIQFFDEGEPLPSLPNLDLNICCGDSLADLSQYARVLGIRMSAQKLEKLAHLKSKYRLSTGYTKKKLSQEIHSRMTSAGLEMFQAFSDALGAESRDIQACQKTLFASTPSLSMSDRRRLDVLHAHRQKLDQAIRSRSLPGFSYDLDFSEILENGGFDMVLGNPPWFSLHKLPAEKQKVLKALYETAVGCSGAKLQSADVSALFVEKAVKCVRENGVVTMLVPNKLFHAPSYRQFRQFIWGQTRMLRLHDWTNDRSNAFDAATYPASVTLVRSDGNGQGSISACREEETLLADCCVPKMSDRFVIRRGICTEANDIFLSKVPPVAKDDLVLMKFQAAPEENVLIEKELVHPVLRGANISAYHCETRDAMVFTHEWRDPGVPLKKLPMHAQAWIRRHEMRLGSRAGMRNKAAHALCGCSRELRSMKVVWRDISKELVASFCQDPNVLPLNTVYYIPVDNAALGYLLVAWLNASVVRACCRDRAEHAQNDYRRYFAWVIGALPWIFDTDDQVICQHKKALIALARQMPLAETCSQDTQDEIDRRVSECLTHYRKIARKTSACLPGLLPQNCNDIQRSA